MRLTKRSKDTTHENGVCCTHFRGEECEAVAGNCSLGCKWEEEVWEKLAYYEDLEEQGGLVVLPEGFDKEKLCKALAYEQCPAHFGLPEIICDCVSCKECWEKALKGGAENVSRGNDGKAAKA